MTGFATNTPRVLKGAIVGVDPVNPLASVIVFQYNPDRLTRRLSASSTAGFYSQNEVFRLKGPPEETITLDVEVDATDQLETANPIAAGMGILPALSALEMLLYPKSSSAITNEALLRVGVIEVVPPEAPLTLFVWGPKRILPVRLTDFSITEEAFDPALNPIRASVSLSLRVLNYRDLGLASTGGALFMAHQVVKEAMATVNSLNSIAGTGVASLGATGG